MDERVRQELNSYWSTLKKFIPQRPERPEYYPEDDIRHWYDMEYAGWHISKSNIPPSPKSGIRHKRIFYFLPGNHVYLDEYASTLCGLAEAYEATLTVANAHWDHERQKRQVSHAIGQSPDLMVILPVNFKESTALYRHANQQGIPVIAGNFLPDDEGFKYVVAWSGPDDWFQFRLLAHKFVALMNGQGGYCILRHMPGTSSYYARTFAALCEIKEQAPQMELLDMGVVNVENKQTAKILMLSWIKRFGRNFKGVISADDDLSMQGVDEAIEETGRHDIIRVAAGSSRNGLERVRQGSLHAITFQSPAIDASTSFKLAADWFEGLTIEPIRYLPVQIITKENIDHFSAETDTLEGVNPSHLYQILLSGDPKSLREFYENLFNKLIYARQISPEYVHGFLLELVAVLLRILRENDLAIREIFESYEYLYKRLFHQDSILHSVLWLEGISVKVLTHMDRNCVRQEKMIGKVMHHIQQCYNTPISIKTLADQFHVSAGYLGQLIRKETGEAFTDYVNSLRVNKAKALLKNTAMTAKEVAQAVGFENTDYFYYVFKKYTGYFPSQFVRHPNI